MVSAAALGSTRFRYETEMVDALEPSFAATVFRSEGSDVRTLREVPAARGVPDLTVVRFDTNRIQDRVSAGIGPLSTDTEVRTVLELRRGQTTSRVLAERVGMSHDYLRRAVLPLLDQLGWVEIDATRVRLRPAARPVGIRVVTVEAKLRDWTKAFSQARNQLRSADAAYIALDASRAASALEFLEDIVTRGIGVVTVDAGTGAHRVVARPRRVHGTAETVVGRMLLSERCLELVLDGKTSGQVAPVFGWTPPIR